MIYLVKLNNKEYEVEVEQGKANIISATEIGAPVPTVAPAPPPVAVAAPGAPVAAKGSKVINAPMPGTILDIKVQPGKRVSKGEILLVFEAMKMENEVAAPADGVIAQVLVAKGASVATGDALIAME